MITYPITPMTGPARRRLARHLAAEAGRYGRLVSGGVLSYSEACASLCGLANTLGMLDGLEQERLLTDAVADVATNTELAAARRVRDAILPLVQSRRPSTKILAAAHRAGRADLPPSEIKKMVAYEIRAAMNTIARRKAANA